MIKIYGIKNCDTMKKAFKWLDTHTIPYEFHDYKKSDIDETFVTRAINNHGWDVIINKRGTTWRQLPSDVQNNINNSNALDLAKANTSIIKRPLLDTGDSIIVGFSEDVYKDTLL